jgi:hypothetical protein
MELRRKCKSNYAVADIAISCAASIRVLFIILLGMFRYFFLDIVIICGIILFTTNAVIKEI